ncbi:phosphatidylinositol 3-kinase 3-like [Sipha flava]|uniref:Phosphatidylinositol 3-kinase 3-like n=1 Tax=Sipha flava TaxID=143950 RepID=A0A8B8FC86_9HEMI|nr:phosphatidylinositol 3-kinase 3-like [Sipha flava]
MDNKKMNLNSFTSSSSEHLKNCSSPNEKNRLKVSSVVSLSNDTSKTKNFPDNSQINKEDCKFIINILKSNDVDLNSQNEQMLLNIVKKYEKDILPSNNENMELNTQTFMDLLLHKATIDLQNHQDVSKNQTIENMDSNSNNIIIVTPPSKSNELNLKEITPSSKSNNLNLKESDEDFITVKNKQDVSKNQTIEHMDSDSDDIIVTPPSKSKELNLKESDEDIITVNNDQDQDPDLITFKTMCDTLLKITAVGNVIPSSSSITEKSNQENSMIFKQKNADVLICENNMDCVPSTSKLNSNICYKPDIESSKNVSCKKRQFKNLLLDSSEESSLEYLNELSQKQYSCPNKKYKFKSSANTLKSNTEHHSDNIVISKQVNDSKKINTFVRNEENGFFYCAPDGKIHQDMLAFISKQKYGC